MKTEMSPREFERLFDNADETEKFHLAELYPALANAVCEIYSLEIQMKTVQVQRIVLILAKMASDNVK